MQPILSHIFSAYIFCKSLQSLMSFVAGFISRRIFNLYQWFVIKVIDNLIFQSSVLDGLKISSALNLTHLLWFASHPNHFFLKSFNFLSFWLTGFFFIWTWPLSFLSDWCNMKRWSFYAWSSNARIRTRFSLNHNIDLKLISFFIWASEASSAQYLLIVFHSISF